jgi:hypothetical protein
LRWAAIVAVALVVGFLIGTWRASPRVETGRADAAGDGGGSIITDDWTYGFPRDVTWVDSSNTWHDNGAPDCVPPLSSVEGLRFAWIEVTIEGLTSRPVVWIDCRSVPQP